MATTTPNFGWPVPTSTDLVKDGATAIEGLGDAIDASLLDLKGGTSGQVLAKNSNTDMDFVWVAQDDSNAIQNAIVDAKGDLIGATAADTPARLAVGANNTVLTADSTTATGLKWATPASGGGMTSIASGSLSGTSLSLTSISGSYKNLQLVLRNAQTSTIAGFQTRINNNTGNVYHQQNFLANGNSTSINAEQNRNSYELFSNGTAASSPNTMFLNFTDYANTTSQKLFTGQITYINSTSNKEALTGQCSVQDNNAITRIDVFLGGGTFTAGTYILYGVS